MEMRVKSLGLALIFLIACGAQVFAQEIVRAVLDGDAKRVQQEIEASADADTMHPIGQTLLYLAANRGHHNVAVILIQAGADVELGWPQLGTTPLVTAAMKGHEAIVRLLIDAGANVDHSDSLGITAMGMAVHGGHENIVRLLIEAGAQLDSGYLWSAEENGHDGVVAILEEAGAGSK